MVKRVGVFFAVLLLLSGASIQAVSQVASFSGSGISANIVEPLEVSKQVGQESNEVAVMLILVPTANAASTSATYYYVNKAEYKYSKPSSYAPYIVKTGPTTLQVASFINDAVLSPESNLIAGVYVSVTPSNITVNYN